MPSQQTMDHNSEPMDTKGVGVKIYLSASDNNTKCYMDTRSYLDTFKFDGNPLFAVLIFACKSELQVYFSDDDGPYLQNVIAYVQIHTCLITQEQLYPIRKRLKIFMLNLMSKYPPLDFKYCDGSSVNKTSCKVWNTLEGIMWMPTDFSGSVTSLYEMLYCNTTYPYVKEIQLSNVPMQQDLSKLPGTFPRLQILGIEKSDLTEPPNFPWSDVWLQLSFNMTRRDAAHEEYAGIFNMDLERSYHMKAMSLSGNKISNLANHTFKGFLHKLDLSQNRLQVISEFTFRNLRGFQHLDLSSNDLQNIPKDCFKGLREFRHLDMKANKLLHIPGDIFVDNTNLVYVDFSRNKIRAIESNTFSHLKSLRELHLEYNEITIFHQQSFPSQSIEFKKLFLDGNGFSEVPAFIFYMRSVDTISLRNSNARFQNFSQTISNLKWGDEKSPQSSINETKSITRQQTQIIQNVLVDFTGSKIDNLNLPSYNLSDIKVKEIEELHENVLHVFKTFRFRLENNPLRCDCGINQISKVLRHFLKENMIEKYEFFSDWKCSWPTEFRNHLLLEIAEKDTYCEKSMTFCPANCTCFERSVSGVNIIDCRNRGFQSLPEKLPSGILDLWFHQNNITTLNKREYLDRIRTLTLSRNNLAIIEPGVFKQMKIIQELFLNSNFLVSLPSEIQEYFSGIIHIEDNPFKCDCHTTWLKRWMIQQANIVFDSQDVTCNVDKENDDGRQLITVPDSDFVCLEDFDSFNNVLVPSTVCSLLLVALIITVCVLYVYRLEVKVLLYIYLGFHPFDQDKDCKEVIDVLIVHSPEITEWVMENIVEYLDFCSSHYLVCEMMRDFVAGFSYQENIATLVKHSKRIIIVLSKEFLKEDILKITWNETQEKIKAMKTNYAIVVSHDVNLKEIQNKDLQQYVKRGRYIDASQSLFQEKLSYCMPQLKGDEIRIRSLPDLKYLIHHMYGSDDNAELYERHAFLSYCESNIGYVMNDLRPILEDNGFTLCLPDRDFIPGAPKEENVLKAIDNCLHTIFLLSGDQLDNEWSLFTFRSASEKSMREKCNHLIVVLGEDVNLQTMGEEVRAYVNTHVSLRVNEKGFIKRLLNALPDIENHELYIRNDDNNFVNFENLHKKKENGHTTIVADVTEHGGKKNGYIEMNGKAQNGDVHLSDIQLDGTTRYHNRAFQGDGNEAVDINENERKSPEDKL